MRKRGGGEVHMAFDNDNLNKMFEEPQKTKPILVTQQNVRKSGKERKVRCDKKHDIKIPLSEEQTKKLRILAFNINKKDKTSLTECASRLLIRGLQKPIHTFTKVEYVAKHEPVHAKIIDYDWEKLFNFSVEWKYKSMKKTAHRILVHMIERGGL